jgi:hypothetical protein
MPITRSGYATFKRNGSTRAYRKARAQILAGNPPCHICGLPATETDPLEADHILAYADHGPGPLRPAHRSCNLKRGRPPAPHHVHDTDNTTHTQHGGVV